MSEIEGWTVDWCRMQWDLLNDRGVWAIPRSGIIFQKREAERQLAVTARMPWMPEMEGTITPAELREQQDAEIQGIRARFSDLGIGVPDETQEGDDG